MAHDKSLMWGGGRVRREKPLFLHEGNAGDNAVIVRHQSAVELGIAVDKVAVRRFRHIVGNVRLVGGSAAAGSNGDGQSVGADSIGVFGAIDDGGAVHGAVVVHAQGSVIRGDNGGQLLIGAGAQSVDRGVEHSHNGDEGQSEHQKRNFLYTRTHSKFLISAHDARCISVRFRAARCSICF